MHTARFGSTGKHLIGYRLRKAFEGEIYEGTISSTRMISDVDSDVEYYHVEYDDGDEEDLALEEMVEAHNIATNWTQ